MPYSNSLGLVVALVSVGAHGRIAQYAGSLQGPGAASCALTLL